MSNRYHDPLTGAPETDSFYTITEVVNNSLQYVGRTWRHSADYADPVWQVKRVYSAAGTTVEEYANQGFFDQQWSNRANLFPGGGPGASGNVYSVLFDGINDYAQALATAPQKVPSTLTVSLWCKALTSGSNNTLVRADAGGSPLAWNIRTSSGKLRVQVSQSGTVGASNAKDWTCLTLSPFDEDWHMITLTVNTGTNTMAVYVDGVAETSFTKTHDAALTGIWTAWNRLTVGAQGGISALLDGRIDELSIWNTALSAAEVTELYNGGLSWDVRGHSQEAFLVSYYRMGDDDGVVATAISDVRANGNSLALTNGAIIIHDAPPS